MGGKSGGGAREHPSKHARRLLPPFNPAPLLPRRAPYAAQDARFANRPVPGTHGVRAVYADDDVHELCEEGVAALARAGRVVRVLFAPGGVG